MQQLFILLKFDTRLSKPLHVTIHHTIMRYEPIKSPTTTTPANTNTD